MNSTRVSGSLSAGRRDHSPRQHAPFPLGEIRRVRHANIRAGAAWTGIPQRERRSAKQQVVGAAERLFVGLKEQTFRMSVVMFNIFCALYRKEPSMTAVQVEKKSYEMPPREGISIAHFLTVADVERSARYYEKVFGARILTMGDGNAPPYLQLANIWMILNVGGGPTPDKPTVTLSVP